MVSNDQAASILSHYSRDVVKNEIWNFSRQRWIGLYRSTMIRYDKEKPLSFKSSDDVPKMISKFGARTVYATAGKYKEVSVDEVKNDKIISYTPFFDIDTKIEKWEYAIRAAEVIVSSLEKEGIEKSVYLLWSGEGIHVRINENSIPKNYDPLTAAHAIVQYVLKRVKDQIEVLAEASGGVLKIDELIDSKRIFTTPLSFHKELNYVAVCFSKDKLDKFSLEWAKPENFMHEEKVYEKFEQDEALKLLTKAIQEYKPRHEGIRSKKEEEKVEVKIGRFQIMGLLQAVRYYVLYNDLDKAKSFGLNRAIFYAWAKYYGHGSHESKGSKAQTISSTSSIRRDRTLVTVAGEQVYQDTESGYYVIGDKEQRPEDYDKEVKDKVNLVIPYDKAWDAAIKYVSSFPKEVLENQRTFFEKVYVPVRDDFVEKVIKGQEKRKKSGIDAFL